MNRRIKTLGTLIATAAIATATFTGSSPALADDDAPTQAQIESAQLSADLMTNALVAALVQIVGDTTPQNVDAGNRAVTALLGQRNKSVRLIGDFAPIEPDTADPRNGFEEAALEAALEGESIEIVKNGKLRRSVPLQYSTAQCGVCHDSWDDMGLEVGDYVGALIIKVPLPEE